ncbi:MAG: hypothetical protein QXT72_03410 [Candidatus Micrarchaeia archaeon]
MQKQIEQNKYEEIKKKYEEINKKFKNFTNLNSSQRKELIREISDLNNKIKDNPNFGKMLEKEMNIILYDKDGKYNGNRFKIMAYWIRREEINKETLKLRDDNLAVIELINEPSIRKRLNKTKEAIENLRNAEIEENVNNIKIRKYYLDIIEIYRNSIEIAKERGVDYKGMLMGMEDAEKFNNFMVGQIDLSLAGLMSKEFAKIIYQHKSLFKNKKEYSNEEIHLMENIKKEIQTKIDQLTKNLENVKEIKERSLSFFKKVASGDKNISIEMVKEAAEKWKNFVPNAKKIEEQTKIEIEGLLLAYSALDRLQKAA